MDLLFLVLTSVSWVVSHQWIKRKYKIKLPFLYVHVNKLQKRIEWITLVVSLIALFYFYVVLELKMNLTLYLFGWMVFLSVIRSYMEWRYDKESKNYFLSLIHGCFSLIFLLGFIYFLSPEKIHFTFDGYVYTENGEVMEEVEVELYGEFQFSPLYGKGFRGQVNIGDKEFFLTTYGHDRTILLDRLKGRPYSYTMIELTGRSRGEIIFTTNYTSFSGKINQLQWESEDAVDIIFAVPATELDEAEAIYRDFHKN